MMSAHSTEAVTLRTYPYAEAHRVVVFLTLFEGIVRGVAHGSQGRKSRFGSSLEPLTHVRLSYRRKENQDLATIQNCEIIRPFPAFELSLEQSLHFSYFTELLAEFGRERQSDERLFRLTLAILAAADGAPIRRLARYFEFWLLQIEGVLPALDTRLPKDFALKARDMLRLPPTRLHEVEFEEEQLTRLESLAGTLIETHLEKQLKSKRLLGEMLG